MAQQNLRRNPYLEGYTIYEGGRGGARRMTREERERRRRKKRMKRMLVCGAFLLVGIAVTGLVLAGLIYLVLYFFDMPQVDGSVSWKDTVRQEDSQAKEQIVQGLPMSVYSEHPAWTEDFLTVNEYSRPGDTLGEVKNIFVHYTANKGTSAAQNRSYFEQLKDTHERSASAHFIIGFEGEIIQCIPLDEIAYAVQTRNMDSISIECCYLANDGSFTQETYDSLLSLLGWLTEVYDLDGEDILRHYDCGGKKCPVYYVKHEDAWRQLKKDVIKSVSEKNVGEKSVDEKSIGEKNVDEKSIGEKKDGENSNGIKKTL